MSKILNTLVISVVAVVFVLSSMYSDVLAANNPVDEKWWPSEFGPDDQAGGVSYITPEKRVAAAKLVKKGMTTTLGMPYYNGMPLVPGRTYALSIPGAPTHGPLSWPGENFAMTFMDELVTAEIGQVGTQWDGLGHPMIRVTGVQGMKDGDYFYNGVRLQDVESPRGLKKMGTEHVAEKGFFTRGILIDAAALKGVEILEAGYAITMADYKAALAKQGIKDAEQGDVVLFHTGWSHQWKDYTRSGAQMLKDNAVVTGGEPGVSPEVCDHLAAKKISMIGSDTWGLEPLDFSKPAGSPGNPGPEDSFAYCHMNLIARRGISNFENLDLSVLSKEKAYEFLFAWSPLKLVGA
ncbi:MAG: cyclase family protein, partial [Nitrospira sp.]|nr:cyclase family protein [Nitrospira sp.]